MTELWGVEDQGPMVPKKETRTEEIARLRREIGERQARLHYLVLGDQSTVVQARVTRT